MEGDGEREGEGGKEGGREREGGTEVERKTNSNKQHTIDPLRYSHPSVPSTGIVLILGVCWDQLPRSLLVSYKREGFYCNSY